MDSQKNQMATVYGGSPNLIINAVVFGPGILGPYACVEVVTNDGIKRKLFEFDDNQMAPSPSEFIGKELGEVDIPEWLQIGSSMSKCIYSKFEGKKEK